VSKNENNFIERELGQFKRKYWLAKLLQGVLIFAGTGLVLIGLVAIVEYFTWLNVQQRTVLVVLTSAIEIYLLAFYILWPALQILMNGAALSDTKAAVLIGSKISGISDRLTNYLELKTLGENSELIDASLSQKQALMKDYSFKQAVRLSAIKPFLLFLIPIFTLLLFVWSGNRWFMIEQGADRLLHFSTEYEKELPFSIEFDSALVVNEGQDYALKFRIKGNLLPQELNIISADNQQSISMDNGNQFKTTFRNCLDDITFQIAYDDILSEEYKLSVVKKAVVGRVRFVVEPPAYTKIEPYTIENSLVVEVPQYSRVSVLYAFKNTKELDIFYGGII
jgi:hypothetical protein